MPRNPELVGLVLVIASGLVLGWWDWRVRGSSGTVKRRRPACG